MSDSSNSDSSDEETSDNIGDFNWIRLREQERYDVKQYLYDHVLDYNDEGDLDFEGFDLEETYEGRSFVDWSKSEKPRDIKDFTEYVGASRVYDGSTTAIEFFQVFYTDRLFDSIVRFTNMNAEKKRSDDPESNKGIWSDVTRDELKAYYGLQFLMDIMSFDREELYWSSNPNVWLVGSKFGEVMSRNRYMQIKRYLHFCDESLPHAAGKLHKVEFILNAIRQSFMNEYKPHREVSVDESVIPFKGKLGMTDKARGVRMWVCADAVSAYCYNFEIYVGRRDTIVNKIFGGLSSKVVIELCKSLEMKGHVIYTDNFYTSLPLADYLYEQKTYLCGTIRPSRKDFPKELVVKDVKNTKRGTFDWVMCDFALASSCMNSNRMVYYLSTFHSPSGATMETERKKMDGTVEKLTTTPTQVAFTKYMGGFHRLEQMTRMSKEKKCLCWYRKIEMKLRALSLYNAYVIEGTQKEQKGAGTRKRDMLSFKLEVAHALIGNFRRNNTFKRRRSNGEEETRLVNVSHLPTSSGSKDKTCVVCTRKHNKYKASHPGVSVKDNPFKRSKTTMACQSCNVALCCRAGTDCYKNYHEKVNYWQ